MKQVIIVGEDDEVKTHWNGGPKTLIDLSGVQH